MSEATWNHVMGNMSSMGASGSDAYGFISGGYSYGAVSAEMARIIAERKEAERVEQAKALRKKIAQLEAKEKKDRAYEAAKQRGLEELARREAAKAASERRAAQKAALAQEIRDLEAAKWGRSYSSVPTMPGVMEGLKEYTPGGYTTGALGGGTGYASDGPVTNAIRSVSSWFTSWYEALPNWGKAAIGIGVAVAGVAATIASGGAAAPAVAAAAGTLLAGTTFGMATGAVGAALDGANGKEVWDAAVDGGYAGMMTAGMGAAASAYKAGMASGLPTISDPMSSAAWNEERYYNSYSAFKKKHGSAGPGKEWHHIVEQSQQKKSGFSKQMINNTDNLIAIDKNVHKKISGYYNSKPEFTNKQTVRNWLAGKSYKEQYLFGLKVINKFGSIE